MSNQVGLHRQAFELYTQGLTLEEISIKLNISPNTLKYWKSSKCKCICGYHAWIDFKKKLKVQVPQEVSTSIVAAVVDTIRPAMTAQTIVTTLEALCSEALDVTKLRPSTWKELLETFKLILDLKRVYGIAHEEAEGSLEIFKLKGGKLDIHRFVSEFMKTAESSQGSEPAQVAALIEETLGKGTAHED